MCAKVSLKSDRYRKSRGGHARWLLLYCEKCSQPFAVYQKDGPGILKRLYLDRIIVPEELSSGHNNALMCRACKVTLGIRIVYEKEKRLAYRLFAGAVGKKIVKKDVVSNGDFEKMLDDKL
jgi:hypothetical protein